MAQTINYNQSFLIRSTLILIILTLFSQTTQQIPEDAVTRFQQYLRINTAHPNPDYSTAVSFLNDLAKSIPNLQTQTIYLTTPQKPLLLVTFPGLNPSLPSILFNSHLDSVPAEPSKWFHPPFSAVKTDDGKIFARGAQDDKCIAIQYLEAIRNIILRDPDFKPMRTIHICYVPEEEIGGFDGMAKFVKAKEFEELNVGFFLDEGQASTNDQYRVFYADRSPLNLIIKAVGMPGHGSRMFDNSAMENLMKSAEVVSKFRETQFDLVKAGVLANSEVCSANLVYMKAGIPSGDGNFVMNMQPSEAEAGYDIRLPPTADPDVLKKRIADEWAPATRNMSYHIIEKGPLRDYMGRPLMTSPNDSNPWWTVFKDALKACGRELSKPEILASTTDARYLRHLGIPAFGFSPMRNTPILLHDHNEFLKDAVFLEGIKVYESIIMALSSFEGATPGYRHKIE
uniref:aminoacylase-1-like n=1 Tax=Erigeron canadensis TaxID=72917 RepID=UPI001CB965C5|nr:aminoacylase-1-like [Erigeron canadensis]